MHVQPAVSIGGLPLFIQIERFTVSQLYFCIIEVIPFWKSFFTPNTRINVLVFALPLPFFYFESEKSGVWRKKWHLAKKWHLEKKVAAGKKVACGKPVAVGKEVAEPQ